MPRQRPPHLQREVTRHGNPVWYVRVGKGPRVRIKVPYGTPEFQTAYEAAVAGKPLNARATAAAGTLQWLYDRYRETAPWREDIKPATRRQRENIFKHVMAVSGAERYTAIKQSTIEAGRDRRESTPAQARNFLDAMRGLFRWALKVKHIKIDPTAGVSNPKRKKGRGFPEWNESDVAAYEARWPIGTRQRVWLDVLLYTGARRGDVHRMGRQHIRRNVIEISTEKNGTPIYIPILPILARTIAAGPCGTVVFVVGARGLPLTKETFGNYFSEAAREAGIEKSAHGVRKIAAIRCADNGATIHQLNALFGWTGTEMASHYTREADRKRLAMGAAGMLVGTPAEHPTPAPDDTVRAGELK